MLETKIIEIDRATNLEELALELNKNLANILNHGGKLEAYSVFSTISYESGHIGATFIATFSNLDSDVGISAELELGGWLGWPTWKK